MKSKIILCLALVLSGGLFGCSSICAQSANTNRLSDGETLARFPALQSVNSILFSTDGKTISTLRGEVTSWHQWSKPLTLQLWAVPSGALLWTAKELPYQLLAFSPDNTSLVGIAETGIITFWNTADGKVKRNLPRQIGSFGPTAFLPNGQTLLTTVHQFHGQGAFPIIRPPTGEIQFWETKTGRLLRSLKGQPNTISKLAVSPDGKTLAVADEHAGVGGEHVEISLLELETGSLRHTLRFDTNVWTIGSLAFSPDGKIFVASAGHHDGTGEIRFWDVASGQSKRIITDADLGSAEPRISMGPFVAFSPDGETLVSVGDNYTMNWWDVATGQMRGGLREADPPQPGNLTVQFTENGLLSAKVNPLGQVDVQFWNYKKK